MKRLLIVLFLFFAGAGLAVKPVELIMWHSLAGHLGDELNALAIKFNANQSGYILKPVYKGEYIETLTSFAAAFRAGQAPALVQIFEVGTPVMLNPKGIIKPVEELLYEQGFLLPKKDFLPAIRSFYSNEKNQLLAMPLNTSIPVIYYNADALAKVGYSSKTFPKTWNEMETLAAKLKKEGYACAYTSAYPAWIQIESFAALHGLMLVDETTTQAIYNNKAFVKHFERLRRWQKENYFEYGGRANDATVLFTSGHCVLFSQSSGAYNSLAELVKFHLGVAVLPLDLDVNRVRHNNVAGGAALWAVAGQAPEIYRGIAAFFAYLMQPETQKSWHKGTGYLPLGIKGIYASLTEKNSHPILALAKHDLSSNTSSLRLVTWPQNHIRMINDEALEFVFSGIKSPQQAFNEAIKKANYALLRFNRTGRLINNHS